MATTKKTAATKAAETKTEEKKTATKAATKTTATKTAEKKTTKKTAAKKPAVKKTAPKKPTEKVEVFVEFGGVQVAIDEVVSNVKATYGKEAKDIKVYVKPDESKAYFVADGVEGEMDVYFC
ncbi:MAG: hypothetical protein J1E56_00630 [Ruminococcus sp.]|nr:hypothetical protein [Ruminococcus sp.]